jgi:hypothetical protein
MVTITRVTKNRARYYKVEGDPVVENLLLPSVTTVLNIIAKPALVGWAKKISLEKVRQELADRDSNGLEDISRSDDTAYSEWLDGMLSRAKARPDQVRDEAAEWGTEAHDWLNKVITQEVEEVPEEYGKVIRGYQSWVEENELAVLRTEWMVYDRQHKFAGTADLGGVGRRHAFIADLKTGSGIYKEAALQLGAYAHCDAAMTGEPIKEGWLLHIPRKQPDGDESAFRAYRMDALQLKQAHNTFVSALGLWRGMRGELWHENED